MQNRKIMYLISTLGGGGAESQLCSFVKELLLVHPAEQFLICVLKSGGILESRLNNAAIPYIVIGGRGIMYHVFMVARLVRLHGITIIHAHMLYADFVARMTKVFTKCAVVSTQHGLGKWKKKWLVILDSMSKGLVDCFITVSDESKRIRISREKYPESKIEVINNGIEDRFCNSYGKRILSCDKIVIGTIARLTDNKQINVLIDAFSTLRKQRNDLFLEIVGDGEGESRLKYQVAELGLAPYVNFLGWVEDVLSVTTNWKIFVLSSISEDLPVTILETMAQGIVSVASSVGGIPFLLKNGELGILCDYKNTQTFIEGIAYLIDNPTEYDKMSANAARYIKENFRISYAVKKTMDIYDKVLQVGGGECVDKKSI